MAVPSSTHRGWARDVVGRLRALYNGTEVFDFDADDMAVSVAMTTSSSVLSSSPTAGIGYTTGAGSTVTQATSRSTGVTINAICGQITMNSASLAAGAEATFTVTNSAVATTDVVVCCLDSVGTGLPMVYVSAVGAGSFNITITNLDAATADTTADVINFAVIKSVTS